MGRMYIKQTKYIYTMAPVAEVGVALITIVASAYVAGDVVVKRSGGGMAGAVTTAIWHALVLVPSCKSAGHVAFPARANSFGRHRTTLDASSHSRSSSADKRRPARVYRTANRSLNGMTRRKVESSREMVTISLASRRRLWRW